MSLAALLATAVLAQAPAKPAPAPTTPPKAPAPPAKPAPTVYKEGFATPESVYFDAESGTYLVSNINGSPADKDNNGYLTELNPDGTVKTAKLVAGGEKGVKLNAPKGLVVSQGLIWVADIDTVRLFDRTTGAPKGEVKVKGATFVNDLFATPDGKVYLTDSGLKPDFKPSGTDAVYVIETKGKARKLKTVLKSKSLKGPNGIAVDGDTIYVAAYGGNEVFALDLKGKLKGEPVKLPKGGLDGLVVLGDDLLVSSWEGEAVYRGPKAGPFTEILKGTKAPADIGYDSERGKVLVPKFQDNVVEAVELQ